MFKWRRRRPKGNQVDRDLEEAARVLEDADFGDYLGMRDRRSESAGSEGDGDPDRRTSLDPTDTGPHPSPDDASDQASAPQERRGLPRGRQGR